jgi:thioredoxin reductase
LKAVYIDKHLYGLRCSTALKFFDIAAEVEVSTQEDAPLPVAIVGGGPVWLAAAANLALRREPFVVFEAGPSAGHSISQWRHVQLFSPWRYCIDAAARRLLDETGWAAPDADALPTGGELIDGYLSPLAAHPAIAPHVRYGARVSGISRQGFDKMRSAGREAAPFEVRLSGGTSVKARAVIDASGTWTSPNPLGANGLAVAGEEESAPHISYGIPDVRGDERARFAGKRVLVVGSGHSAINSVLDLIRLRESEPATSVLWAMRRPAGERLYGGETNDALPARGALGSRARAAIETGNVALLAPFRIVRLDSVDGSVRVAGELEGAEQTVLVDEIIVATGFRPDLDMLRELRLSLDPGLEATAALAPLIDPNVHSCGTVPPHGYRELAHAEAGFFVVGMKSYGRAPTFLMATGYEQVRSVVAHLAGDEAAATRVELVLPETGVCGLTSDDACCGTSDVTSQLGDDLIPLAQVASSACCGGPALSDSTACCALDETAKASGEAGCGCGAGAERAAVVAVS